MQNKVRKLYDCAIVGGGLAGLSLAIQLAKANKSVILFEKKSYPFHKVCGEYIAMESWDFLSDLGIPLADLDLPRITNLTISAPNGNFINHQLDMGGFGISRFTLDFKLAQIAQSLGVVMQENTTVEDIIFDANHFQIKTSQENYQARVACGAYGKRANLDVRFERAFIKETKAKLQNYIGVKYHIELDFPHDLIELHNFKDGYCGISKVDENRVCLCYLTTAQNLKENNYDIKQMEENVLMKNPFLKAYFAKAKFLYDKPLTISQISFTQKSLFENHILMLGDAAGMITPLCGNGMSMALHSSKIAFGLVNEFLEEKMNRETLEKKYQQIWHKTFAKRLKTGRIIQSLFGKEFITNAFLKTLKPFPKLVNKLIGLTHGKSF